MASSQTSTASGLDLEVQVDSANEDISFIGAHHSMTDRKQPLPSSDSSQGHRRSKSSYSPANYVPVSYTHRHKPRPPSLSFAENRSPWQATSPAASNDNAVSPTSHNMSNLHGPSLRVPNPKQNNRQYDTSSTARHSRVHSDTFSPALPPLSTTSASFHTPVSSASKQSSPFLTPVAITVPEKDTILAEYTSQREIAGSVGNIDEDDGLNHGHTDSKHMSSRMISQELVAGLSLGLPYTLSASLLQTSPDLFSKSEPRITSQFHGTSILAVTCILVSITLLCMSITSQTKRILDPKTSARWKTEPFTPYALLSTILSIGLPFYSSLSLGAGHVAIAYLLLYSSGSWGAFDLKPWRNFLNFAKRKAMLLVFLCQLACDASGITSSHPLAHTTKGYFALITSLFVLPPVFCLPKTALTSQGEAEEVKKKPQQDDTQNQVLKLSTLHPFNPKNSHVFFAASIGLTLFAMVLSMFRGTRPVLSPVDVIIILIASSAATVSMSFVSPSSLSSAAVNAISLSGLSCSFFAATFLSPTPSSTFMSQGFFSVATYSAIFFDLESSRQIHHDNDHRHHDHVHAGYYDNEPTNTSSFTRWLLHAFDNSPLLFAIVRDKDSRKIFYFMLLNFGFMIIQMTYGIVTGSLGLLSDSIHMLFDCLALAVGLSAAVMSKWPPNARFPYGYGKVDTLAGFANGIFLMIISAEIIYEAIERLTEGAHVQRLGELLFVSTAGLLVNIVGIMSFDHAHHGHGHSHNHDSSHGHHHQGNHNENMHGIFLHILADTLGSVAVVVSTILVHFYGWSGFDPIASCVIAVLIFASAVPLVKSTANSLLLVLPADVEYRVRNALGEMGTLGDVVGYAKPRFWMDDRTGDKEDCHDDDDDDDHHHHHNHDHHGRHHHHHDHFDLHSPHSEHFADGQPTSSVLGAVHIIACRNAADLDQVRRRTSAFLQQRGLNITVQVEREGDVRCWCGGGSQNTNT